MNQPDTHILVQTTCPDLDCARDLAKSLLDQKLAGCINLVPGIESHYIWEGERKSGNEVLLLIKTRSDLFEPLQTHIKGVHPYELPEIIAVPVTDGLPAYLNWISESTR